MKTAHVSYANMTIDIDSKTFSFEELGFTRNDDENIIAVDLEEKYADPFCVRLTDTYELTFRGLYTYIVNQYNPDEEYRVGWNPNYSTAENDEMARERCDRMNQYLEA